MVRRSLRTSGVSNAPPTPKTAPKRTASSSRKRAGSPSEAGSARASKRGKEKLQELSHRPKAAGTNGHRRRDPGAKDLHKSDEDSAIAASSKNSESSSDEHDDESHSYYGEDDSDQQGSAVGTSESPGSSDDSVSESDFESNAKSKGKGGRHRKRSSMARNSMTGSSPQNTASSNVKGDAGSELWRQGVKAGLGPGTEMVIKRPKPRDAGNVPYTDTTIHPNTMLFLGDLTANNDREWLKMHDAEYRRALKDFQSFIECLSEKIIEIDDTIPELPTKDIIFRIYRDIRFSPDPTPYKTHFSAAWSRTGRKGPYAAYYMQIKPGNSYVGGGLWMPEATALAAIRNNIDERPQDIKSVLTNGQVQKEFFAGTAGNETKTVKAFVSGSADNALKTKPKGYTIDHPNIELLRLRNFIVGRKLADKEVIESDGLRRVAEVIAALVPFVTYLNDIVHA